MKSKVVTQMPGIDNRLGKERSVQRMFSSIAETYDINNTILSFGLHHVWKRRAVRLLSASKGDRILDICAGTGDLSKLLSKAVGQAGSVISLDLNNEMLTVGKIKHENSRTSNILCVQANAEVLSVKNESVDKAIVAFGMRNLENISTGFVEIHRVMKKGGRVVCLEFSKPVNPLFGLFYRFYSFTLLPAIGRYVSKDKTGVYEYLPASISKFPAQEKLRQMMTDAGFSNVRYKNYSGGIVAVHIGEKF